jgi:hypothetical protein
MVFAQARRIAIQPQGFRAGRSLWTARIRRQ